MDDNIFKMAISNHFFVTFQELKFRGIEVARYLFHDFIKLLGSYDLQEIQKNTSGINQTSVRSDVFSLVDSDYPYTINPGSKIFIHPWEFLKDILPLLPEERLITSVGVQVPNPAALSELLGNAEAVLQRCSGDYLFGSSKFRDWFFKNLSIMVTESDQLADVFDRENIGCVVARCAFSWPSYWPCRSLLWLAKSRRIPSIAYQPGLLIGVNDQTNSWWPVADMPIVAAFKTVWGPQYQEFFKSFGVPAQRLPIIGNPRFDKIFTFQATRNVEFRQKYGIPATHRIILHTTQPPNPRRLATVRVAAEAVRNLPECTLLIKTRDKEYPEEKEIYQDIIRDNPRIKLISEDQPIYDLIANSDVVLVFFSTTGLEAILFGKPVVVIDVKQEEPPYSYVQHLGVPEVQNSPELTRLLQKLMTDPQFAREVKARVAERLPYLMIPDGKALPRLADLILKVADGEYKP